MVTIENVEYKVDETTGDILNQDGTVFKTKADYEASINQSADNDDVDIIKIDGVEYKFNETGDALNADGTVFKTKAELDKLIEDYENSTLDINKIADQTNLFIEKDGAKVVYENTAEGIATYTNDVYLKGKEEAAKETLTGLFNEMPIVKSFIDYVTVKGTHEGFGETVKYTNFEVTDKTDAYTLESIIKNSRLKKGDTEEQADRYVKYVKSDNKTLEEAKVELAYLQKIEKSINDNNAKIIADQEQAKVDSYNKVKNDFINSVKSGVYKLNNTEYAIPQQLKVRQENGTTTVVPREALIDYMFKEVDIDINGKRVKATKYEFDTYLREKNRSIGDDIYEALKLFTKSLDNELLDNVIKTKKAKEIREIITTNLNKSGNNNNNNNNNSRPKIILTHGK